LVAAGAVAGVAAVSGCAANAVPATRVVATSAAAMFFNMGHSPRFFGGESLIAPIVEASLKLRVLNAA
jgi:hypothetical protein